jgi:hypothetical protein
MNMVGLLRKSPLTRLAALGTPGASEMRHRTGARTRAPRGRSAGKGGLSPKGWVGEGNPEGRR